MCVRLYLIEAIPVDTPSYPLQDVVVELVGADLSTAKTLLDRSDLKDIHRVCLRRGPSESWMERALVALERGWTAESIVAATEYFGEVLDGRRESPLEQSCRCLLPTRSPAVMNAVALLSMQA